MKNAETFRNQGLDAYFKRDFKTAFKFFEKAAELGDAEAQCRLGEFYDDFGEGFPVDFKKARELYEKSYDQGFARAGTELYMLYADGNGVKRDKKKAQKFLDEAFARGEPYAKWFKALQISDERAEETLALMREAESDEVFLREFGKYSPIFEFTFMPPEFESPEERDAALKKLSATLEKQAQEVVLSSPFFLMCGHLFSDIDDDEAEKFLRKAAACGASFLQAECAYFLWLRGKKDAGTLALKSVEQTDNVKGMIALGACYLDGSSGLPQKTDEAEYWLKKALDLADPEDDREALTLAEYWLGRLELDCKDNPKAAEKYFRRAAEHGDNNAMVNLCQILFAQGKSEVVVWAKKLQEGRFWQGDSYLASCYRDGLGVKKDSKKFVELVQKLDENDISDGTYMLATAYRDGLGVPEDTEKALELFKKADELGDTDAAGQIAEIYFHAKPADERTFKWAKKGAEAGDDRAMVILACCYHDSIGTVENTTEELAWNLRAAEAGNRIGALNAGFIYYQQDDYCRARELLEQAHELGEPDAAALLSKCEFEDDDGDKDAALRWAKIAVKNDDPAGYPVLGACYFHGCAGLKRDRSKAIELWKKGAELGDPHCAHLLEDENEDVPAPDAKDATNAGSHVFCIECGAKNPAHAKFCHACGAKLHKK